jgi:hypothetical protein
MKTIEEQLAIILKLPHFQNGPMIIRDKWEMRVNEIRVEYCWLVKIEWLGCRAGLFRTKFAPTEFREFDNKEALTEGIFLYNMDDLITDYYIERNELEFTDLVKEASTFNLFDSTNNLYLDGVHYRYHIMSPNLDVHISVGNPDSDSWREWESQISKLARDLAIRSKNKSIQYHFPEDYTHPLN